MIRVLVLEDQDQMRKALVEALEDEGYEVDWATRGEQAVEKASQNRFDLLITDIRMEGMDGLEALRHVRSRQPDIHSMVVTGYSTEDDSIRAIRLGAGDYLRKPFKLNEFLKRVNRLVVERRRQIERAATQKRLQETSVRLSWALGQALEPTALRAGALAHWICSEIEQSVHETVANTVALCVAEELQEKAPPSLKGIQLESEARVVPLAIAAARLWPELEDPAQELGARLEELEPGRFDPFLLRMLKLYPGYGEEPADDILDLFKPRATGLHHLGRTLEESGDLQGARRAYELLTQGVEAVEGWMGLARLAERAQQRDEAVQHLRTAIEVSREHGPARTADALLRAAIHALNWGDQVNAWLQEALELLEQLNARAAMAEARLALRALRNEPDEASLEVLLEADHLSQLLAGADWIMPWLLECRAQHSGSESCEAAILVLLRERPASLEQALSAPLSREARAQALELVDTTRLKKLEGVARRLLADGDEGLRQRAQVVLGNLTSSDQPPLLVVYSFGPFEVFRGRERVEESAWRTVKAKYLLAYLLSRGGQPVSEDRLLEMFWPGPTHKGKRSLNTALSALRKCLLPEDAPKEMDYFIRGAGKVQFNTSMPYWHDLEELEKALTDSARLDREGATQEAAEHYARIAQLYRGPYLEECYLDWVDPVRTQWEQRGIQALSQVANRELEMQRPQRALEAADRLVEISPCEEESYRLAMRAALMLGRHTQAVRLFETCKKTLRKELSMEPSIELLRLHQEALLGQTSDTIG